MTRSAGCAAIGGGRAGGVYTDRVKRFALSILVSLSFAFGAPGVAAADTDDDDRARSLRTELAAEIGKRALRRGRRAITLGPYVGVAPGIGADAGDLDVAISGGLALLKYDIPLLPTRERLEEIVKSRFRAELVERLKDAARGGEVSGLDRDRIAREVWAEIKAELLLELAPKRWEKPSLLARLEVSRLPSAEAWDVRLMLGYGVGPVFLSAGPSLRYADGAAFVVPVELSKPMMLSRGLRAPVLDFFLRAELAVSGRDAGRQDVVLLGARLGLDVI